MKIIFIMLLFSTIKESMASGLEEIEIRIGEKVHCEGWPDYEKDKIADNKRHIYGEVLAEEDSKRISIYGRISNPMDDRDRFTTPFLLLKKMCMYVSDSNAIIQKDKLKESASLSLVHTIKKEGITSKKTLGKDIPTDSPGINDTNINTPDEILSDPKERPKKIVTPLLIIEKPLIQVETATEYVSENELIPKTKPVGISFKKLLTFKMIKEFLISFIFIGLFGLLHSFGTFEKRLNGLNIKGSKGIF